MSALRKVGLFFTGAAGFVLGSRAGRKPYELLEEQAHQIAERPQVQAAKDAAIEKAGALKDKAMSAATEKAGALKDTVVDKASAVRGIKKKDEKAVASNSSAAHKADKGKDTEKAEPHTSSRDEGDTGKH